MSIAFVLELLAVIAAIVLLIDANWLFLTEDPRWDDPGPGEPLIRLWNPTRPQLPSPLVKPADRSSAQRKRTLWAGRAGLLRASRCKEFFYNRFTAHIIAHKKKRAMTVSP